MSSRWAKTGWALAVALAIAAVVLGWQYARVRQDARDVRRDYEVLQKRVEEQAARNEKLDASLRAASKKLTEVQTKIEALGRSVPPPAP